MSKRNQADYVLLAAWVLGLCLAAPTRADVAAPIARMRRLPGVSDQGGEVLASVAAPAQDVAADGNNASAEELPTPSIEERLADLETKCAELEEANASLEDSLSGYIEGGHGGVTAPSISGRIHLDMWNFPGDSPGVNILESGDPNVSPQDRIGFRRMRLDAEGDLPYNMLYKLELELAGGNDIEFRDAYFGWNEIPFFQTVLWGNQKRPYGLDHINSSRYNVFIERPFVVEGFNQDARRLGVCCYGITDDLAWNWRYGLYNQRLIQDEGNYISDHLQGQAAGRLANTIWYDECSDGRGYAHWAISGTWADTDPNALTDNFAGSGRSEAQFRTRPEARTVSRWLDTGIILGATEYQLLGLESVTNVGPFQLVGEFQNVWVQRSGYEDVRLNGAYGYVSYFLTGEHIPWNRESGQLGRVKPFENFFLVDRCRGGVGHGMGAWQLALRYSYADFNDADVLGGVGQAVTFGLNWHWTPYSRMQFNYIYGEIDLRNANSAVYPPEPPNVVSGDYHILGTRLMVDF